MPFVMNDGLRIHYVTIGDGAPLVLHHGTSFSGADWIDLGYVDPLKDGRQLILIDSRGHGESDKPHDPAAYLLSLRASDVTAVLDQLGHRQADFFGYSLGGWVGFGLAKYSPQRINSFVIGGANPNAETMQFYRDWTINQKTFLAGIDRVVSNVRLPTSTIARWRSNDVEALHASSQDRESVNEALATMTMPCLFFAGELDPRIAPMKDCASRLPNASFFAVPHGDHASTLFMCIDEIVPRVRAFLDR